MKAVVARALGSPENFNLEDVELSPTGPGELRVDVYVAGVSYVTALVAAGRYQVKPPLPFIPGGEFAGVVAAVGPGVTGFTVGDRVLGAGFGGGFAEAATIPAASALHIPAGMSFETAAVFRVAYGTAYHALVQRADLKPGETLLVLGAAGGVGLAAVQIGRALGARVVAAASSPEKLRLCATHGADELIDYRDQDLAARLAEVTGGAGVDVVYDPVGGPAAQVAVRALAWGGRYLTVGYASGDIPRVGMNRLLLREGELLGVLWGAWAGRNPGANAENMSRLLEWYSAGRLRPHVERRLPLAEAAAALNTVRNRGVLGKIVLDTGRRP